MDEFEVIAAELLAADRFEQEEQARELLGAADHVLGYADLLRRVPVGEAIGITMLDGTVLRGRIVRVGADWIRLAEVADEVIALRDGFLQEAIAFMRRHLRIQLDLHYRLHQGQRPVRVFPPEAASFARRGSTGLDS